MPNEKKVILNGDRVVSKVQRFYRVVFEPDNNGMYITPLIGLSWRKGDLSLWFGWLFWLITFEFFPERSIKIKEVTDAE